MTPPTQPACRTLTASALAAAAALHVAWGHGSTFPYTSPAELTDRVVGSSRPPSPTACYAVAAALAATAVIAGVPPRSPWHRGLQLSAAAVFATRAAFGFAGRTDLLMAGSTSPAFRRQDRRLYSPICLALAAGLHQAGKRSG